MEGRPYCHPHFPDQDTECEGVQGEWEAGMLNPGQCCSKACPILLPYPPFAHLTPLITGLLVVSC